MKAKAIYYLPRTREVTEYNDMFPLDMSLSRDGLQIEMESPGAYIETYLEFPTPSDALEFAERVRRLAEEWQRISDSEK